MSLGVTGRAGVAWECEQCHDWSQGSSVCVLTAAFGSSSSQLSLGTLELESPFFPIMAEDFYSSLEASFGRCGKSLCLNKSLLQTSVKGEGEKLCSGCSAGTLYL